MPCIDRCSSPNRFVPSRSVQITRIFHLSPMSAIVRWIGQASLVSYVMTIYLDFNPDTIALLGNYFIYSAIAIIIPKEPQMQAADDGRLQTARRKASSPHGSYQI